MSDGRFRLELEAAGSDIDDLGHVSNLVFVRWVLEAATAHSRAAGLDTADYVRIGGVFVVRRHEIEYLSPAFAGDRIALSTWVDSWGGASCVRRTLVVRTGDDRELARAATTWAFVSTGGGRPRRIPEDVRRRF
jgi:acyl-CoA thioester hydrolase